MNEDKRSRILPKCLSFLRKKTVVIVTSLMAFCSTIDVGLKLYQSLNLSISSQLRAKQNAEILQLSSYGNFGQLLKEYRTIQLNANNFENQYQKLLESSKDVNKICKVLIEYYKSGASIYYSQNFSDYKKVHDFFETLGLLIDKDAIDFNLVFHLFTFPGELPKEKYSSELPKDKYPISNPLISLDECIASNWFGENKPLRDFGVYVKQLGYNYTFARLKLEPDIESNSKIINLRNTQIKNLEENQCSQFYRLDSAKPSWIKIYPGQYDWNDINKYLHKC